ncbi:DedA family protein [Gemmobacter straminiformis]|uniref:DedA family protein n=2 Tax=Paragemmobacter straminiformis TaxID=2045119 RepID=A0A842I5S9_9RHOB|nr:DedA family protein [Gemmobacter straminiformis]
MRGMMSVDAVLQFLERHQDWSFLVTLVFAFAETLAFLSLLVPSTAILVGVGALISTGALDFLPIWAGAATGAVIGSSVSWWLGARYGEALLKRWPMNRDPLLVARATEAFRRWGLPAVFIGHFFGPLRAIVFLFAGMTRIPFWRFQLVNLPGCLVWAWFVPKSGEIGGEIIGWLWGLFGV